MKEERFKTENDVRDTKKEKDPYTRYQELGGIINQNDYKNALAEAKESNPLKKAYVEAAEGIARKAGIVLDHEIDGIDPRVKLYAIMRADNKPEDVEYHHSQMSDQRLFAEALRMLGDADALNKLIGAYHKTGTYCPICLKVVVSDEECH